MISGRIIRYIRYGIARNEINPGTRAAMAQPPQVISMLIVFLVSSAISGFAAMEVRNMAQVTPWT